MHDPMTVVRNIPNIFSKRYKWGKKFGDRPSLITIWHVDPEKDGTDDSCGWAWVKYPEKLHDQIKREGEREWGYFFGIKLGAPMRFSTDLEMVWAVWDIVDWRFGEKKRNRTLKEINYIFHLAANPMDNLLNSIRRAKESPEGMGELFDTIYRLYISLHRPWWKHPRWHFWHWKIQLHPVQHFKRWAFSRCQGCGGHFLYGESVTSTQWEGTGPLWFRSERNIYHSRCVPHTKPTPGAAGGHTGTV